MYWNSSERWHHRRGNGWVIPLVIIGLIVLTHGWILIVPLMAVAAFAFFGFFLPRLMFHMNQGGWHHGGWQHGSWRSQDWSCMGEKHKHNFQHQRWGGWHWESMRDGEKHKRDSRDDIDYV